jgi:DNA-binding transcriptional LysR family regulator
VLNLPMREANVAIRMKEPSQPDLVRKKLMTVRIRLYASQTYLDKVDDFNEIEDIGRHRPICQSPSAFQVAAGVTLVGHLLSYDKPNLLHVNNYFGVLQAVLSDLGIGVLPDYVTEDFPTLVHVLLEIENGAVPVYLAYPEKLRQSKRIMALRDFVQDEIIAHRRLIRDGAAAIA